jgi:Ni/Co efflux regulator RcnB
MHTRMMRLLLSLVLAASTVAATGCAAKDRRDAAWDPRGGQQLIDQTPNWDGAAGKKCCGHLRSCEPHQSPRC